MDRWPRANPLLTLRETQVLAHMATGARNREIAALLFTCEGTVKTQVESIIRKLGVENRTQAVVWGIQHGLKPGEEPSFENQNWTRYRGS